MEIIEAIRARHSVRAYTTQPIEPQLVERLNDLIHECNELGNLNMRLVTDEPDAFGKSFFAHYGKFSNVTNYIVMAGPPDDNLDQRIGYYGERIVIEAQRMGLNTCWVALSYNKRLKHTKARGKQEKVRCLISIGHGATQGVSHKIKRPDQVSNLKPDSPDWFRRGVAAALLAPTAINQQKFYFQLMPDGTVSSRAKWGPYSRIDLGIVRYHFEAAAGKGHLRNEE